MITQPAGAEQGQTRGFVPRQADEIRPAFLRGLYKVGPAAAFLPAAGGQAARDERALAYARRALAPLPQARVAAARSEWDAQNSRLAVRVTLDLGGGQAELEVRV